MTSPDAFTARSETSSRGSRNCTCGLTGPSRALCVAELHPEKRCEAGADERKSWDGAPRRAYHLLITQGQRPAPDTRGGRGGTRTLTALRRTRLAGALLVWPDPFQGRDREIAEAERFELPSPCGRRFSGPLPSPIGGAPPGRAPGRTRTSSTRDLKPLTLPLVYGGGNVSSRRQESHLRRCGRRPHALLLSYVSWARTRAKDGGRRRDSNPRPLD